MSTAILPITTAPTLVSDERIAMSLAVLEGQSVDVHPWLSCRYANIKYDPLALNVFDLCEDDPWFAREGVFFKSLFSCDRGMLGFDKEYLLEVISFSIENGEYVTGAFDAFYVPSKSEFGALHRKRYFLIYGIDTEHALLYLLGETAESSFGKYTLSFDDFWASIESKENRKARLEFLRFNSDFIFKPDLRCLRDSICKFLGFAAVNVSHESCDHSVCGLSALSKMREQLRELGGVREFVDRNFYLKFCDFQTFVTLRCESLSANFGDLTDMAAKLRTASECFFELCQRFNHKDGEVSASDIIYCFDQIVDLDRFAYEQIYARVISNLNY